MASRAIPEEFQDLLGRLRRVRRRLWAARSAVALVQVVGLVLFGIGALVSLELLLRPGYEAQWWLTRAVLGPAALVGGVAWWARSLRHGSLRAVAARVQSLDPSLGRRIECALDLVEEAQGSPLARAALRQIGQEAARAPLDRAARVEAWPRRIAPTVLLLLTLMALTALMPRRMGNALLRVLAPAPERAVAGHVRILRVEPGAVEVLEGAPVAFAATVDRPHAVREAWVEIRYPVPPAGARPPGPATEASTGAASDGASGAVSGGGPVLESDGATVERIERRAMRRGDEAGFVHELRAARRGFQYRIRMDDTASAWYTATVRPRPRVLGLRATITPPAYTGRPAFETDGGAIRAPLGSDIALTARTNLPVRNASLHLSNGQTVPLAATAEGCAGRWPLTGGGRYTLALIDEKGNANLDPTPYPVEATPDHVPTLRVLAPTGRRRVAPGERVAIRLEARDDHGLKAIALEARRNQRGEPRPVRPPWTTTGLDVRALTVAHAFFVDPDSYAPGDVLTLQATATDHAPGGDRAGRSRPIVLEVQDPGKAARQAARTRQRLQRLLGRAVELQKEVHRDTFALVLRPRDKAGKAGASDRSAKAAATARASLSARQAKVRTYVLEGAALLVEAETSADRTTRRVLRGLAANELPAAMGAVGRAVEAGAIHEEALRAAVAQAIPPQAEVIKRLHQILGVLEERAEAKPEAADAKPAEDLPPALQEALRKLKDGLDGLKDTQRKVIDAGEALTKKPVDDFTPFEEKRLDELRAAEEDWADFLREAKSDLSKVPKQDFSNPSLLGEVIAVLEAVELVAESLTRKETKIAVAASEAGLELAESLEHHLEKWLPDAADHKAWSMEEPLGDYETPMAELPEKLEDIIGELIEQEEELMAEAEDTSSSYADSLDEGAGWGAADGPISNYSAQGVTGNQLPNDTEVGGRAGEGRQGKSHGEFVSDTAVGKGGRRTPSRLTPDPYEAGRVEDKSDQASAGATGGGKKGAAGAQGLEGPPPPMEPGPLPRLQGKQAELRNKAERLALDLKLRGYNTAHLENTLQALRGVEEDLRAGRYRDAGRRARYAVEGLRVAKDAAVAEAEVRADHAAGLPRDLQREILDTVGEGMPEGYEELIQGYYERLAEDGAGP